MTERPADANTTRGLHLRRIYRHPAAISVAVIAVVVGVIVALAVNAIAGAGGGLGLLLFLALVLFVIADAKAEEDFFKAYAEERGLTTGGGQGSIPPSTDLLRKGVRRYSDRTFAGTLPGGLEGLLAFYTYETESRDSKGRKQVHYHHYTVVLCAVPESVSLLGEMACQRRAGFRFFDKAEDAFRTRQRVEMESEEVDKRYEIFIGQNDDMGKARQLLSPIFLDWLATGDDDQGFELEGGMLAVNVPGQHDEATELDALCEATAYIRTRISEESLEGGATAPAPATSFNPASYVVATDTGKTSARMKKRLWGLVGIVGIGAGLALGFVGSESEDTSRSSFEFEFDDLEFDEPSGEFLFGPENVKRFDDELLPVVAENDSGEGAKREVLYGNGVSRAGVDNWTLDAIDRGLIIFNNHLRFELTDEGQEKLDSLES